MNRRFQRWVNHPTQKLDAFLVGGMAQQPERKQAVEEARRLILSMRFADDLTEAEIASAWIALQNLTHAAEQPPEPALSIRLLPSGMIRLIGCRFHGFTHITGSAVCLPERDPAKGICDWQR